MTEAGMKTYEVWMEGYSAQGNGSDAQRIGSAEAETFVDACDALCAGNTHYHRDPQPNIWMCRLFDNEADARKSFG